MASDWYYAKGKQKFGPVDAAELKRLAATSILMPEDLVWKQGQPKWLRASSVKGLFPHISSQSAGTAAPTPTPTVAVALPAITATEAQQKSTSLSVATKKATFLQWYRHKCGNHWMVVQGLLWIFYGFIWIPMWWLFTRHTAIPEQLSAMGIGKADAAAESRGKQELEKIERLQGDGQPFIEGEIVRISGVNGLAKGMCSLRFEPQQITLGLPSGNHLKIPYESIKKLQIAGKGHIVESVDNAFVGGGFGLGGALQGVAQAALLNAAVAALTRRERYECELALAWQTGDLVIMNREYLPEIVNHVLHPFIAQLPS